ncbi:uncharacterized protein LOC103873610 [Brassica rapa]|nr:uncharacterized protein LOC103873610 [Brassica rapa]XP_009150265.1 uncharacterized protein LOC103873610 [Brassica rapa]XP_009150266.1 uncharacterized protein LOC103873610 [Brassica rapa]XP_009150267.1 uncharacterized protein LOC103873610 [Brassica rapa]XP_018515260.1 uncharacterized protein LOC103873610 [Brassica rapa]XP_018515261.1 uncharacterized protein LOC103873610 [Brassica rapa]XP_033129957.1 uncharacterized protein LOC103873610 [Brassica rapa]
MISIVRWEPVVDDNYPSKITFWVRAIGVPLHFWAEPTFRSIGEALGVVRGDDAIEINEGKIRATLDAFKPLVFSITVEFHSGEETVVALRYERLHGFCRTCSKLTHDQFKCPISKGQKEEDGAGPSDDKGDQGGKALSYKGAVESKALETNSDGDVRRHAQQVSGKQDVKGKNIDYEGGKQVAGAKAGPGRGFTDHGRRMTRYVRNAGYLPPQELRDSYAMATGGLNGLRSQDVGAHLDPQQKLMLDAFKSSENVEASGSKARKALLIENEAVKENGRVLLEEGPVATVQAPEVIAESIKMDSIGESKEVEKENAMELSSEEFDGKQSLETVIKEDEEIGEMVAGLDEEDGNLEFEMMEDDEEEAELVQEAPADGNVMEIEEAFPTAGEGDVAGEKENMTSKKKAGKFMADAMGGNAKKRLVQSLVSPRKKAMAKQGHKAGDKGPVPTKKASFKPKPVLD